MRQSHFLMQQTTCSEGVDGGPDDKQLKLRKYTGDVRSLHTKNLQLLFLLVQMNQYSETSP